MKQYKIGVDLGGTKAEAILLGREDRELYRTRISTPGDEGYPSILRSLYELILDTIRRIPPGENYSIGVGIPGTINSATQLVQNANTTCLIGRSLQKDLEDLLGQRVNMENDANCFTLAESRAGAAKGYRFVFGIIMGTGCGGGICFDGNVWQGIHGIAGEWGHFSVDPQGTKCYCGNRGCVETKISGSGVESAFFKKYQRHIKMQKIVDGYRTGDSHCTDIFQQFLEDFGRCLGGIISVLDPDVVVLGGGLSNIDELYQAGVDRIRQYAFHDYITTPVIKNRLGDSAGVFGAAWLE